MVRGIPYDDFNNALDESLIKVNNLEPTEADKDRVLDMIDKIKADSGMNSYQKGKLFEDMIESIVLSTKIFKTIKTKLFIKSGGNPGNRKFNGHYKPAERDGVFLK